MDVALLAPFGYIGSVLPVPAYATLAGAIKILSWPFGGSLFRYIDSVIYAHYQRYLLWIIKDLGRTSVRIKAQRLCLHFPHHECIKIKLYGDTVAPGTNAIYIANHQCTVDWFLCNVTADEAGLLGNLQFVLKNSLKYIPFFGNYWREHGFIYIRRQWAKDEERLKQRLIQIDQSKWPYWLVVYPEGTRSSPAKLAAPVPEGIPKYEHVLAPRTKGFVGCATWLRPSCDAVYDVTIAYEAKSHGVLRPPAPELHTMLGSNYHTAHIHVTRIPMCDIPEDSAGLRKWLHERFAVKNKLLTDFYNHGQKFPDARGSYTTSFFDKIGTLSMIGLNIYITYFTKIGRKYLLPTFLGYGLLSYVWGVVMY